MKGSNTWDGRSQPSDEASPGSPGYWSATYEEMHSGLTLVHKKLLEYSQFVQELELDRNPLLPEISRIEAMIEQGEAWLQQASDKGNSTEITLHGVSYGSLRYLKAGILLKAEQIKRKRSEFISKHDEIPKAILEGLDEKIAQYENLGELGFLAGLKPADIFFVTEKTRETGMSAELISETTGDEYKQALVPVIDPVLRDRCLQLFESLPPENRQERLDILVREMSVILEDRIRKLGGGSDTDTGVILCSKTMSGEDPPIKFSDRNDIQEAAHLLFRGYAGFIRNEVMHKLVDGFTEERAMQLLGMVDYLLFILAQADRERGQS